MTNPLKTNQQIIEELLSKFVKMDSPEHPAQTKADEMALMMLNDSDYIASFLMLMEFIMYHHPNLVKAMAHKLMLDILTGGMKR